MFNALETTDKGITKGMNETPRNEIRERGYTVFKQIVPAPLRNVILRSVCAIKTFGTKEGKEHELVGNEDRRRLRVFLNPPEGGEYKPGKKYLPVDDHTRKITKEVVTLVQHFLTPVLGAQGAGNVYQPTAIVTFPGAAQQKSHHDANIPGVFSCITAITDRTIMMRGKPVNLVAGDVILFNGGCCHSGAMRDRALASVSVGMHFYCGWAMQEDVREKLAEYVYGVDCVEKKTPDGPVQFEPPS